MRVYFLNDSKRLNKTYRAALIHLTNAEGYEVRSVGIYNVLDWLSIIVSGSSAIVFSSNMRANLCNLLLFWVHGVVLFNGLGRLRAHKGFRQVILALISISRRKHVVVQNYADYRYFSRCGISADLVLGSGGVLRDTTDGIDKPFIVSRATKLPYSLPSAGVILKALGLQCPLVVVGASCGDAPAFDSAKLECVGVVGQSDIFMYGSRFLQPHGYGEGFPHSLADAIITGLPIYMEKRTYVQLGLYKLNVSWQNIGYNVGVLQISRCLTNDVGIEAVNHKYAVKIKEVCSIVEGCANEHQQN